MKKLGDVILDNPFIAAPMAGISDAPMRSIVRRMGASFVCTEMVSAKGLLYGSRKTNELLRTEPDGLPYACQLFGSEPAIMARAAEAIAPLANSFVDINMGCPVPKVVRNGEGSALLKNLDKLYDVAAAVVRAAGKPVTAKIRTGWDEKSIVCVEAAKALEAAGVAMVAVHGRTRCQFYTGRADWSRIAQVKRAVSIPVAGSGDVFSAADGLRMMEETGCDFVMVARGMLGNPWIFRDLDRAWRGEPPLPAPTLKEKGAMMLYHYHMSARAKREDVAVREMRKHAGWYFKGEHDAASIRRMINSVQDGRSLEELIRSYTGASAEAAELAEQL
ncbi:MAG: tRNA dihydrouridine synthase DusB [Eubacteriales bacterium]|jgi:tRNA-dihydrouridine synthase B|nr:tRNA dihydrouridine synthase DusB [Eubacteriales bacterium]